MWDRKVLKQRAKEVLRTSYWKAFLVSMILVFVSGGGGSPPTLNFNLGFSSNSDVSDIFHWNVNWEALAPFLVIGIIAFIIFFVFSLAFRIFVCFPLEVGSMRYFKQAAEYEVNLNHIGYAFNKHRYWDVLKAMLWRSLLNFLWFLLLFIPGIVKSYAYSMVPYILADNPNIGYRRAVELSNDMTRGSKFRIFVLELSFLGWILLGLLLIFVGVFFVMPYIHSTKAELYLALREQALKNGLTSEEELRLNQTPVF